MNVQEESTAYLTSPDPVDNYGNALIQNRFYYIPNFPYILKFKHIDLYPDSDVKRLNFEYYYLPKHVLRKQNKNPAIIQRPWRPGMLIFHPIQMDVVDEGDTDNEDNDSVEGGSMPNKRIKTIRRRNKDKTIRRRNKNKTTRRTR